MRNGTDDRGAAGSLRRWFDAHAPAGDVLAVGRPPGAARLLPARADRSVTAVAPADPLPVLDASCDAVVIAGLLDGPGDPRRLVAETVRVLRPGGCALVTVAPGPASAVELLTTVLGALRPSLAELVEGHLALVAHALPDGAERELRQRLRVAEHERERIEARWLEAVEAKGRLAALLEAERETSAELSEQLALRPAPDRRRRSFRPLRALVRRARSAARPSVPASTPATTVSKFRTLSGRAALALREGRHATAGRLAAEALRVEPVEPRATFVAAAARWEYHEDGVVEEVARMAGPGATDDELEVAVRFFRHVEDLPRSFGLLARMQKPRPALVRELARALGSRGHCRLALEASTLALELEPGRPDMVEILDRAKDTLAVITGASNGASAARGIDPVAGRVVHLVQRSLPHHVSGGTVRTHNLLVAQLRAGIDAHATTQVGFPWTSGVEPADHREVVDGVPYHHRPATDGGPRLLSAVLDENFEAACELLEMLRPALLHPASDHVNALVALRARERYGIPVVYEVRGFPGERLARREGFRALRDHNVARRELELRCWHEADRLVTLCQAMKAHIVASGIPAEKVAVVPNAADPVAFRPRERDAALAGALGLDEDEVVLGYISTLNSYEGLEYLIAATGELAERGHRVRALVVGGGPSYKALRAVAKERGLGDRVVFTGRVDHAQVRSLYTLIDVFVVPRRLEATSRLVTPLKPFEAMASGIPLVVSGTTALREVVHDGELGLTFEPENVMSLADAVESLIEDPARRRALADRGREWIVTERTWDHNAALYRSLYEEVLAGA